jgi:hypothetical protein
MTPNLLDPLDEADNFNNNNKPRVTLSNGPNIPGFIPSPDDGSTARFRHVVCLLNNKKDANVQAYTPL